MDALCSPYRVREVNTGILVYSYAQGLVVTCLFEFYVVFDFIGQNIMMMEGLPYNIMMMEGLPDTVVPSNRLYIYKLWWHMLYNIVIY